MCLSDASPPSAGEFTGGKFSCQPSSCQLAGSVNGTDIIMSFALGQQYDFVNGSKFDVDFGTKGHLRLWLASTVALGQAGVATGALTMPMEAPVLAGDEVCAGDGSRFQPVAVPGSPTSTMSGVNFILRCLSDQCASALNGEIDGCCTP
jgi:hypothetical protein